MGAVNIKFNRLQEDLSLEEVGETRLEQRRGKKIQDLWSCLPWRTVCLVLSLSCLLLIISLNRKGGV